MIYEDENEDENLLVVAAVEGYAENHHIQEKEVFKLFQKYEINKKIRHHYNTLHTQDLDDTIYFAECVLKRKMA